MIKKAIRISIDIFFKMLIIIFLTYFILCTFGFRFYVVPTGSMEPVIHAGSLVIVNENVDYLNLSVGDIIVYNQTSSRKIIHRIIEITEDGIKTQGDANPVPDGSIITTKNYVGRYVYAIPKLGLILDKMNKTSSKLIWISLTIGLCVLDSALDKGIVVLKKKKN